MNAPIRTPEPAGGPVATPGPKFVHLRTHSAYSLLEGALPITKLAKLADKHGFPAVALTDTNNLFGVLEFSNKLSDAGIQPIAGVTIAFDFQERKAEKGPLKGPEPRPNPQRDGFLVLLAMSDEGYANLLKLVSKAHLESGETDGPHIKLADLSERAGGLIVLTGGPDGVIDRALTEGLLPVAEARLSALQGILGDRLYVELQRHGTPAEHANEPRLIDLAYRKGLPLVATNQCFFASPDDYEAHDALLCIAEGRYVVEDNRRRLTKEHYFKSADEMAKVFADLPEALESTVEIAKRCAFRPKGKKPILPAFVKTEAGAGAEERQAAEAAELKRQAEEGLLARLAVTPLAPGFTREDYEKRLAFEVDIITKMKFPGYFLIVADFIKWSKANGIPVGPGRGSGAGSVVAWALTITDLDPLRFGLLFERFLNPERVSMPDFDIDFCQDKRERTILYVQEKYGKDRVAQIITHGKLQARAVLRDVGRVLQMSYGQVDKLCKLVPNNPANPVTLPEAIEGEPKLQEERDNDPMVARLIEIAIKLEGLYRHASTHAAGMVIGDRPLDELVPMYRDPKSNFPVTQFNWKFVEAAGLVKFDFLGLKTLTVLQKAVDLIKRGRGVTVDLSTLSIENNYPEAKAAYDLLARAETVGVFQLESTGMRESLKRLKPDRFEDIIAMVALYRPGPMDNIPTYINRKHGEEPVDCLHPILEPILKETYGVIIYQEQVMQIAQVMAGYSLGQADLLRRAMGKKDKNEMAKQQALFVEGAMKNGVKKDDAVYIFELVDKFAGYGFNKSHAAAYALVSYHTAWLKANYAEEFLAASMSLDMGNTDKLAMFAAEARRCGISIEPPCINMSDVDFLPEAWRGPTGVRPHGSDPASRGPDPAPAAVSKPAAATAQNKVSNKGSDPRGLTPASREPTLNKGSDPAGLTPAPPTPSAGPGAIRYSLAALKNIGAAAIEAIVAEREVNGKFKSLGDFASRINPKAINKRGLETLATAGAFDTFDPNRAQVHANVEQIMALANRQQANAAAGTVDMFAGGGSGGPTLDIKATKAWTPMDLLQHEFEAIGFFLSGHPLDGYATLLPKLNASRLSEFLAKTERGATAGRLAGIVIAARERKSAKGNKFAFATFSDPTGQFETIIFSDTLAASRDLLEPGTPVLVSVEAERDGDTVKMRAQSIEALDKAANAIQRGLKVVMDRRLLSSKGAKAIAELKEALKAGGKGEIRISIDLQDKGRAVEFSIPGGWDVSPAQRGVLTTMPGVLDVVEV